VFFIFKNKLVKSNQDSILVLILMSLFLSTPAFARKTNQAVYQDPFDLGAGGASLTRASKDGRVHANPALLPYGGKFHYWGGLSNSVLTNKESVDIARDLFKQASGSGGGSDSAPAEETPAEDGSESESTGGSAQASELMDKALAAPIRVGWGLSLAWVTRLFALSVFSRLEMDLRAREFGQTGFPEAHFQGESYHGVLLGTGVRTPFRWLSFGVAGKYVYGSEPDLRIQLTDTDSISQMSDPKLIQDLSAHKVGTGADLGMLMFFQGQTIDFSLAGKVEDLGNTKFVAASGKAGALASEDADAEAAAEGTGSEPSKNNSLEEFKQVVSVGTGLTFHTGSDALHLALDYRDILNAYGEKPFKKIYAGAKVLLRTYVGLSAGYYQGYPTYGAEVDLILVRLAGTYYTRELGDSPGVDPRRIYMVTVSAGI
jgi:hypothetical protein